MTLAASVFAVALSALACGEGNRANDAGDTAGTSGNNANKPVTLTGCLQRGDGSDFMLSQASQAPQAVGTSGANDDSDAVANQHRAAALRTYRLTGDDEQLRDLVGHRVRVSGTLEDRGDLAEDSGNSKSRDEGQERRDIDEGDLAEVEVASVESIAKTCGAGAQR